MVIILLLLPTFLRSQHHLYSHDFNVLYEIDISNCAIREISTNFKPPSGGVFTDIAVTPNNRIFAMSGDTIYEIDPSDGKILNSKYITSNVYLLNSLVAQSNDYLLSIGQGNPYDFYLVRYSIKDGSLEILGSIGSDNYPSGDLAWYKGKLYMPTIHGKFIQITLSKNTVSNVTTFDGSAGLGAWGMSTFTEGDCESGIPVLYLFAGTEIYSSDPATLQTKYICNTPYSSAGASSTMDAFNRFPHPICSEVQIFIPSLFTPNGDGKNDDFFPMIDMSLQSAQMQIFNRWGDCIYEEKSNSPSWNGKKGDSIHSSDVYYYLITTILENGEENNYKGTISLIH